MRPRVNRTVSAPRWAQARITAVAEGDARPSSSGFATEVSMREDRGEPTRHDRDRHIRPGDILEVA